MHDECLYTTRGRIISFFQKCGRNALRVEDLSRIGTNFEQFAKLLLALAQRGCASHSCCDVAADGGHQRVLAGLDSRQQHFQGQLRPINPPRAPFEAMAAFAEGESSPGSWQVNSWIDSRSSGSRPPSSWKGLRNSFISHRLAFSYDINTVAYESGNSPEMIRKYCLCLVAPDAAQKWFSL